jgi:nicotinate-nucleotide adenylyltransferase
MNKFSGPTFAGRRIGLLGGSFNPAHAGHRAMSLFALKRLGLHQIWWLVSPQNPLKPARGMAPLAERLASARKAARHPRIVATAIETELGTRYTADTLRALKRHFPNTHFVWLMGADNMRQVTHWRNWRDLFASVPVAVFRRPAYATGRGAGKAAQAFDKNWQLANAARHLAMSQPPAWLVMDNVLNSVSATEIRKDGPAWPKRKRR